jgi:enoyl-CoA hydratase/carnithine racemase
MKYIIKEMLSGKFHHNLQRIRHLSLAPFKAMSTSAPDSKVIFQNHTPSVFEFTLNVPKTLNSVDLDMCNMMIPKV